ncbi:MAG TPA: response regulator transcription factor, partial [Anaerolineales bacterium]
MLFAVLTENEISADYKQIKVLIVDDHAGVRAGIRNLLRVAKDISIVGEAENGRKAIELADITKPDIVLLDVQLPDIRGDDVLVNIHKTQPDMKVLVVSSFSEREYVQTLMDCGANGYLTKDEAPAMLVEAIHSIIRGTDEWISPMAIKSDGVGSMDNQLLTKRETDILKQLLLDRSDYEIAVRLGLDENLVGRYLKL